MSLKLLTVFRRWHPMGAAGLAVVPAVVVCADALMARLNGAGLSDAVFIGVNLVGVLSCVLWTTLGGEPADVALSEPSTQ